MTKLVENWHNFFESSSPEAKYLQIGTSQGCIHIRNALLSLSKELRQRIIVLAIAPAAYISKELCYRAYNYESERDFVPRLQNCFGKVKNPGAEVTKLKPHPQAPLHDHSYGSPTFYDPEWNTIRNYVLGKIR